MDKEVVENNEDEKEKEEEKEFEKRSRKDRRQRIKGNKLTDTNIEFPNIGRTPPCWSMVFYLSSVYGKNGCLWNS